MKKIVLSVLSCMVAVSLAACGSSSRSSGYKYAAYDAAPAAANYESYAETESVYGGYAEEAIANGSVELGDKETFNDTARKLIKTYNLSLETDSFDALLPSIDSEITNLGGYVQNLDTYNGSSYNYSSSSRYCYLTARIPTKNLEAFVSFVGNAANVTNKNLSVEDITLDYVDTSSRKKTYEVEYDRLLSLLEKAENMEDIITIESRLSEVRYHLESMESQLRTYDNLVDYATVYININEVKVFTEPEPETYGQKIARSFKDGFNRAKDGLADFFVGFVGAVPTLVVLAVIAAIVILIIKGINRANRKKREKKLEKRADLLMNSAKETAMIKAKENNGN